MATPRKGRKEERRGRKEENGHPKNETAGRKRRRKKGVKAQVHACTRNKGGECPRPKERREGTGRKDIATPRKGDEREGEWPPQESNFRRNVGERRGAKPKWQASGNGTQECQTESRPKKGAQGSRNETQERRTETGQRRERRAQCSRNGMLQRIVTQAAGTPNGKQAKEGGPMLIAQESRLKEGFRKLGNRY